MDEMWHRSMDRFINILAVFLLNGDMIILCKTTFIKLYFSSIWQYTFNDFS